MKTIKAKVFKTIQDAGRKGLSKQGVLQAIWKGQGKRGNHQFNGGYWAVPIRRWINKGLVYRPKKGVYKLTKLGKLYITDIEKYKMTMMRQQLETLRKHLRHTQDELWEKKRELRLNNDRQVREFRHRIDSLEYELHLEKEARQIATRRLANMSPDGVYTNDHAVYFVLDKKIIMQLNTGGMFKTTDTFMGGAKKSDELNEAMANKFNGIYENLQEW